MAYPARLRRRPSTLRAFKCDVEYADDQIMQLPDEQSVSVADVEFPDDQILQLPDEQSVSVADVSSDEVYVGASSDEDYDPDIDTDESVNSVGESIIPDSCEG